MIGDPANGGVEIRGGRYAVCRSKKVAIDLTLLKKRESEGLVRVIDFECLTAEEFKALVSFAGHGKRWDEHIHTINGKGIMTVMAQRNIGYDANRDPPLIDLPASISACEWVPLRNKPDREPFIKVAEINLGVTTGATAERKRSKRIKRKARDE